MKDILNRDIVNLENCESEPIHIPGAVQNHGFLVAMDEDRIIRFCSENVARFYKPASELLNRPLKDVFASLFCDGFDLYLSSGEYELFKSFDCDLNEAPFTLLAHRSNQYMVLEFEPVDPKEPDVNIYQHVREFLSQNSTLEGIKPLCEEVCKKVAEISGYDRVMVYRFDKFYNGEIFAEVKKPHLESFLGLHYPHTDIPVQARNLYLKNMLRIITDVQYTPSPLLTHIPNATHASLDLGMAVLRSVSPIHVEYLQNMGVGATLTISLISQGRLWGLIACHHYSPKFIAHPVRMACLLQASFLTSQIEVQQIAVQYRLKQQLENKLENLKAKLHVWSSQQLSTNITAPLLELPQSTGVHIYSPFFEHSAGQIPPPDKLQTIKTWLKNQGDRFESTQLEHDLSLTGLGDISGLLYFKVWDDGGIVWFRNGIIKEISWGGEPEKAIVKDAAGLHPRKSFEKWQQVISGHAPEWLPTEVEMAAKARNEIELEMLQYQDRQSQQTLNQLVTQLKQANEDLENMQWIGMHDLKEPLRKVVVFSNLLDSIQHEALNADVRSYIDRIKKSAARMNSLLDDMLTYARMKQVEHVRREFSLKKMIEDVFDLLADEMQAKQATLEIKNVDTVDGIPFYIQQLFFNLFTNAAKFARNQVPLQITVTGERIADSNGKQFHRILVADNGKGFSNEHKEKIFKIFLRLESSYESDGNGIGLAICKRIAEIHHGDIFADGVPGQGATITLLLPVEQPT